MPWWGWVLMSLSAVWVVVLLLFILGMCRAAGEYDADMERLIADERQGHSD